jgi:hypothetical protein
MNTHKNTFHSLEDLLAANAGNPLVRLVRWFFFYPDLDAKAVPAMRLRDAAPRLHKKSLAH